MCLPCRPTLNSLKSRKASVNFVADSASQETTMSRLAEELLSLSRSRTSEETAEVNKSIAWRFSAISFVGDVVIVLGVLAVAFWLRFRVNPLGGTAPLPGLSRADYLPYIGISGLSLVFLLAHYGVHHASHLLRYRQVSFLVIKGCSLWFVGMLVVTRVFIFPLSLPWTYIGIAAAGLAFALLFWRALLHWVASFDRFSRHLRERILFVGWNEMSERLTKFVTSDPSHAYTVVGCIPPGSGHYEKDPPAEIPHIAAFRDIVNMLRAKCIDIVMLADRTASMTEIDDLATICERELVQMKVIPSYFQILVSGLSLQTISGIPILGISQLPLDRPVNQILKRAVDIFGSIIGLILSAPIIAFFAAFVYLESPGPIFYRQRRVRRGGVAFDMFKIRSMRLDADQTDNLQQSTPKNDPRLLKVGAFMRRWNIDETPQFWNVLKGEMSLVGPRPERIFHSEKLSGEIPHYSARYWSKPGMTGWAAVNGLRGDTDLSERIRCDLYYLENWSLWLDFQIMFLTFSHRTNGV